MTANNGRTADEDAISDLVENWARAVRTKNINYEVRPRKDHRGVDLVPDTLPFGRLWYGEPNEAVGYATFHSRSYDAIIRVYEAAGSVSETHEDNGDFKENAACLSNPLTLQRRVDGTARFRR
jgi:hypothetical protein